MKLTRIKNNFELLSNHIKRHTLLMIFATAVVAIEALFFSVYWHFDENYITPIIDLLYLIGNIFFLVISVALNVTLIISRLVKFKTNALPIIIHIYVFLLVAWGTTVCVLDLKYGLSPAYYLVILTMVAGLFIVEPLFFIVVILSSGILMLVSAIKNHALYFSGDFGMENILTVSMFFATILLVALEHFSISMKDLRYEKRLEQLTYYDDLTGLLNERSYLKEIEDLDKFIEEGKINEYAVILMDLNNIKATNDTYGHRYGCHLIVRCGHMLPQYFKSSRLFHIGGDEFVAIVYGEDYQHLDEILKIYEEKLTYSLIEFEGRELIFSLAHGVAKYESGLKYKNVLQKADNAMYLNKKEIKEKYGMKGR